MRKNISLFLLLIVVLSACSADSSTGAPSKSSSSVQNVTTGHKLFVFLSGFTSQLSSEDVAGNGGYGSTTDFFGPGSIQSFLQTKFPGSYFLTYSYMGFNPDGTPKPYACPLATDSDIADLAVGLRSQISQFLRSHTSTPRIDVYIIGHSLGGVIALSFLAQMVEGKNNLLNSLPNEGKLRGIFALDSPIGGVTDNTLYVLLTAMQTRNSCKGANYIGQPVVKQLNDLFKSAALPNFRGATASVDSTITLLNTNINQVIALDAMRHGVTISTFGNINDVLWQPNVCSKYILPDFLSTQWLKEVKSGLNNQGGAVYARSFTAGQLSCNAFTDKPDPANHFAVLSDSNVQAAIWQVIIGQAPNALTAVPIISVPTPTPTPSPTTSQIAVQANSDWQDSGISIQQGEVVTIVYVSGNWRPWPGVDFDGNGCTQGCDPTTNNLIVGCDHGGLIGRIGSNQMVCILNGTTVTATESGQLYLRINDQMTSDDSGAINIRVTLK